MDDIDDILEDKSEFIEQNHSEATYASKIKKEEGKLDWNLSAKKLIGKINGLFPVPGGGCLQRRKYKILKAELASGSGVAGEVLSDQLEIGLWIWSIY